MAASLKFTSVSSHNPASSQSSSSPSLSVEPAVYTARNTSQQISPSISDWKKRQQQWEQDERERTIALRLARNRRNTSAAGPLPSPDDEFLPTINISPLYDLDLKADVVISKWKPLIDIKCAKRWLRSCQLTHKCHSLSSDMQKKSKSKIRVVDCQNMCLVNVSITKKYFALSYTWGKVDSFQTTVESLGPLTVPGALKTKLGRLSKTVEDAIGFVKALDERYLWVDRLCIVQDDPQEKHKAINSMAMVYMKAHAVIIAAAGCDAMAGLPGIEKNRLRLKHPPQSAFTSGDKNLLGESLVDTVYETRCWTFQERFLACRKIFFCDEFAFFQCREAIYRDDVVYKHSLQPPNLINLREADGRISPDDYMSPAVAFANAISAYSKRQLSHQSDILYAFTGILEYFGNRLGSKMSCGLPDTMLAHAICWRLAPPCRAGDGRRAGFSSWSWCGWSCQVRLPQLVEDSQDQHLWTSFKVREVDSRTKKLPSQDHANGSITTASTSLSLEVDHGHQQLRTLIFDTVVGRFRLGGAGLGGFGSSDNPGIVEIPIYDCNDVECGNVQLLSTWASSVNTVQEFVILKDSRYGQEYRSEISQLPIKEYNKPRKNDKLELGREVVHKVGAEVMERPYYIVIMTVRDDSLMGNGRERAGIGYIYKRAIFRCVEKAPVWMSVTLV